MNTCHQGHPLDQKNDSGHCILCRREYYFSYYSGEVGEERKIRDRIQAGHPWFGKGSPLSQQRRFWLKVRETPGGCWEWTGANNGVGYGRIKREGRYVYAHRYAYELLVGPIPDNLQLDHLCSNHPCVRPDHLEPVTSSENIRRAYERGERKKVS